MRSKGRPSGESCWKSVLGHSKSRLQNSPQCMATPAVRDRANSFRGVHEIRALRTREPVSAAHSRSGRIRGLDSISETRCSRYTQRSSHSCLAHFRSLNVFAHRLTPRFQAAWGRFQYAGCDRQLRYRQSSSCARRPTRISCLSATVRVERLPCHFRRSDQETADIELREF